MRTALFAIAGLLLAATGLHALELTSGKMRLDVYDDSGRFSLFGRPGTAQWTPLFYSQDPRTSSLMVATGNDIYRLGDDSRFKQQVTKQDNGAVITWTSSALSVIETFTLVTSIGATQPDGIRISIVVSNLSSASLNVGIRYLIDTYLGEQSKIPFVTDSGQQITAEKQFSAQNMPAYWLSSSGGKAPVQLEVVTHGQGVTIPDRLIFANWKRLNDAGWSYNSTEGASFTLLPYSINDSAAALYYAQEPLAAGAQRSVTMLMGLLASSGWSTTQSVAVPAPAASPTTAASAPSAQPAAGATSSTGSPTPVASAAPQDTRASVVGDLSTTKNLIDQIDQMLDGTQTPSASDIDGLQQVLQKLEARKSTYSQ